MRLQRDILHYTFKDMEGDRFFLPMKDGKTPQLFFRHKLIKINDGTYFLSLQYLSTCGGGWFGSCTNGNPKERKELEKKLIKY